ncbi:MAG: zinc ribbon domain-containing protein, partial [Gemmatimonadetes bacterium]|nr:zinc ribbon domain-containing protein [Gemmatimonadota bacterium]
TLYLGVALVAAAVVLFILQPVVRGLHASLEREDDELTETEARKRVALLALRDVEYDFLSGKLDEDDYRSLKAELTAEALAALEADEAAKAGRRVPAGARQMVATTGGADDDGVAGAASDTPPGGAGAEEALEAEIARMRGALRGSGVCPSCAYSNEEGSRFCSACGHALADTVTA